MSNPVETELYELLEISVTATQEEVKKGFRKQALQHHPDKGGDETRYKKIQEAYEILSDESKRELYNRFGKQGSQQPELPSFFRNGMDLFNLFRAATTASQGSNKTAPIEHRLNVTLEQLCTSKQIKLRICRNRPCGCAKSRECTQCSGSGVTVAEIQVGPFGRIRTQQACNICRGKGKLLVSCGDCEEGLKIDEKDFMIHLSPLLANGCKQTFTNEGHQNIDMEPGDIIVTTVFEPHPQFKLSGADLIYEQKITLKEALCGHNFSVTHPNGQTYEIRGNEILHKGVTKRLTRQGLTFQGDLCIKFDIIFPETLTEEQQRQLELIL